ncbi:MAG: Fic family protein [candidate division Zixibacteria bacterium]|nr:Fic family protein [candidate division Zixibacteria bacterium]
MDTFRLVKPDLSGEILAEVAVLGKYASALDYVAGVNQPEYLYWDKVRYKPRPPEMSAEKFWAIVKSLRQYSVSRVKTVVQDDQYRSFTWQHTPGLDRFLHEFDMKFGGASAVSSLDSSLDRRMYISRGIMEEAIASSQLEGASTTRQVAREMLIQDRKPRNKSEQMIHNNYRAMLLIEDWGKSKDMDMESLLGLHSILAKDTVASSEIGRIRRDEDKVVVMDAVSGEIYHVPPSESYLREQIPRLVEYANGSSEEEAFEHPFVKGVLLHFWIGYLHPFTDGNGRLARALFYWFLLRQGYWAVPYLSLSKYLKSSPAQYRDAYIYSEQDDNDVTYFIDYNVRKTRQAAAEFEKYVDRKTEENRSRTAVIGSRYDLNARQVKLLHYLHKNPDAATTIKIHASLYGVTRVTARADLESLEAIGFLSSRKVGRERPFRATEKLVELSG